MAGRIGIVKRVIQAVVGGLNFPAFVRVGIRQSTIANMLAAIQRPALTVIQSPSTLLVTQRPALSIGLAPITSLAEQRPAFSADAGRAILIAAEQRPALNAAQLAASTLLVSERPAFNWTQVSWDLVHQSFVVTMTNDTGNTQNWTNPANAQEANNGVFATWANALAILQLVNKMHGTTVAQPNRPASLLIDSVHLAVWGAFSGLPIADDLTTALSLGYRIGGITALDVQTHRYTVSGGSPSADEVRIDDGAGAFTDTLGTAVTWANIALLQFYANATALAGINPSYSVDALRLRVVAHEVQTV